MGRAVGVAFTQNKVAANRFTASVYGVAAGADTLIRSDPRVDGAVALSNRNMNFSGSQSGKTASDLLFQAGVYGWHMVSGLAMTPSLTFQEIHVGADAHQTSGAGVFNMNVSGQHFDMAQRKLGGRLAYPWEYPNSWIFTPEAHGFHVRYLALSRCRTQLPLPQVERSRCPDRSATRTSSENRFHPRVKTAF